jgi:hypothetical protein
MCDGTLQALSLNHDALTSPDGEGVFSDLLPVGRGPMAHMFADEQMGACPLAVKLLMIQTPGILMPLSRKV